MLDREPLVNHSGSLVARFRLASIVVVYRWANR